MSGFPYIRPRRLRQHSGLRAMVRESRLCVNDLIYPLFIHHDPNWKKEIGSMPGQYQLGFNALKDEIVTIKELAIPAVILFGIPSEKDANGSGALDEAGIVQQAIGFIKSIVPDLLVISDICFCEYTDHGHCGVVTDHCYGQDVDNDATLALLAEQALSHAKAGADILAPSGMMDGMIKTMRVALDGAGYSHLPLMSYAVKYASAFYGPFRDAAEGTPQFGDRRTYQMDPANVSEALREADLDVEEGADILMVKPAMAYLDVISQVKQRYREVPMAAYQVSGEYAMLKAAAMNGWLDEKTAVLESLLAIRRAGADMIITYFAKDAAGWVL